jgi:hypothetical protein
MSVLDLWLPIVLTGLATHILSTLAWTVLPHHKPEWVKMPAEDELYDLVTKRQVAPGQYIFPFVAKADDMKSEAFQEKSRRCTGMLVLWSSPTNMGKAMGLTLLAFMVIAFVIAYLSSIGLARGAAPMRVFQFVTTAGLLAHVAAKFPFVFWFRRKIAMDVLDGIVYAVVTGLIFAFLWPK